MILINPSLDLKVEKCISDQKGRFIILKLLRDNTPLVLVNVYAPNDANQQVAFFTKLNHQLQEFALESIIIGGDFNCPLSQKDKTGGNPATRKASVIKQIENLCDSQLVRHLASTNPNLSRFTWRKKSLKIQSRLDYFLISKEFCAFTKKCEILWAPESDHSAVSIHLQSEASAQKKGPGFWKFNTSLLTDETYIAALRENLQRFKAKYVDLPDLGLKWDLIKMEMRGFTVQYSKRKAKMLRDKEISLCRKR